jgi:predicted GNAT family N-acyltransferase
MGMLSTQFGHAQVGGGGYVSNVFVKDEYRGQGKGHDLMRQVTQEHGNQELKLNSRPELHAFYSKHGFEATGDEDFGQPRMVRPPS